MIFGCLPRGRETKCEWVNLADFVVQYNKRNNKAYRRVECLDINERETKALEVRLECKGEIPIVIEHKSVAWPPDYFRDHHNFHYLLNCTVCLLADVGRDSSYELEIAEKSLNGRTKRQVESVARDIVTVIRSNESAAKSQKGISRERPIPWRFYALPPEDEDASKVGIRLTERPSWITDLSQLGGSPEAISGYTTEFERAALNASEKFVRYEDCLKLLLVHFHGDGIGTLLDDEVVEVIRTAQLPELVDQVWLAQEDWIDEDTTAIIWHRVC